MLGNGCVNAEGKSALTSQRHVFHSQIEGARHLPKIIMNLWVGAVKAK